jgi:glycosyltransferase involved in cell wall biosynthesis
VRITFVLPFRAGTGGVRAVLRFARGLETRGHTVQVVAPAIPYSFHGGLATSAGRRMWLGTLRRNLGHGREPLMREASFPIRLVPWIAGPFVPDADVVIATAWPTARSVVTLPAAKGRKVYYIFHRELDSGPASLVDASYRLPLFRTALSNATAAVLRETCGVGVDDVTPVGVDAEWWGAAPAPARSGVLSLWGGPRKGGDDVRAVFARVSSTVPGVPCRLFGSSTPPELPAGVEFIHAPADERIRELYAQSSVFLYASRFEGFGMPPLEAMAAGCAVVTTPVGAVPEFSRDGVDAVWVTPGDVAGMTRAVLELLADRDRAERLGRAARERAGAFGWEPALDRFEAMLRRAAATTASG